MEKFKKILRKEITISDLILRTLFIIPFTISIIIVCLGISWLVLNGPSSGFLQIFFGIFLYSLQGTVIYPFSLHFIALFVILFLTTTHLLKDKGFYKIAGIVNGVLILISVLLLADWYSSYDIETSPLDPFLILIQLLIDLVTFPVILKLFFVLKTRGLKAYSRTGLNIRIRFLMILILILTILWKTLTKLP